jgi:hypothetical protein
MRTRRALSLSLQQPAPVTPAGSPKRHRASHRELAGRISRHVSHSAAAAVAAEKEAFEEPRRGAF